MRDRNDDRNERRGPDDTLDRAEEDRSRVESGAPSPEPMPDGPNEDGSFGAEPPADVTMNRTSDDDGLNVEGGGFTDTPLRTEYETIARRDDLSRRLEDLVADAREWARESGSEEARDVVDSLTTAYERLGVPTEDTIAERDVAQAEPGEMEAPGRD